MKSTRIHVWCGGKNMLVGVICMLFGPRTPHGGRQSALRNSYESISIMLSQLLQEDEP